MSLSADRFQTRGSLLARLANEEFPDPKILHSRTLGLNISLVEFGLSASAINDLVDIYGVTVARAVSRLGHEFVALYNQSPDIPNLAEVVLRHGEIYAKREVIDKGKQPYDVL